VVDLFFYLEYIRSIFQSVGSHDQLVKHRFSVRFLCGYTVSHLAPSSLLLLTSRSSVVMYMLNKGGPRVVFITGSVLILVGNWIRYAGTRADNGIFGVVMFGQLLLGLAQPFALAAPTRYSDLWFSEKGRTSATALATLANPLGAAIGELVDSVWTTTPGDIPNMVLYISIIVRLPSSLR
jgi:sugar phosphate permease